MDYVRILLSIVVSNENRPKDGNFPLCPIGAPKEVPQYRENRQDKVVLHTPGVFLATGLWGKRPCVTSPLPETDPPKAKQLSLCLLSKSGLR